MNIELCKNCNKECTVCFYDYNDKRNNEMILGENVSPKRLYYSYNVFRHHNNGIWKTIKSHDGYLYTLRSYHFVFVKLNKNCPYYVEHQLSDWNEKK